MIEAKRAFILRALLATTALVVIQSEALAGAFALREQSAYGQGTSFAGIAAGGSLSSMFWNPATLAAVSGLEIEAVGTMLIPTSDVDISRRRRSRATRAISPQDAFLPALYGAYRLNDRLTLGVGVNSGYGLVTRYDGGLGPARQRHRRHVRIFSIGRQSGGVLPGQRLAGARAGRADPVSSTCA